MTGHMLYIANTIVSILQFFLEGEKNLFSEQYFPISIIYLFMRNDTLKTGKKHFKF